MSTTAPETAPVPAPEQTDWTARYQELYRKLDDSPLGKPWYIKVPQPQAYSAQEQAKMGVALEKKPDQQIKIAHVLPANLEGTAALILTPDDQIIGVELVEAANQSTINIFRSAFGETGELSASQAKILDLDHNSGRPLVNTLFSHSYFFAISSRILSSSNPQDEPKLQQMMQEAEKVGLERLERIKKTEQGNLEKASGMLQTLFDAC